ncbi:type III-A CRISPR-associated protein Csm2 [Rhabdobacter roseus]
MPDKISITILTEGIKDLRLLKEWGDYLAKPDKEENNRSGKDRITKDKVSTSQLRRFFGAIKRIQADFDGLSGEVLLLEPKLAYAVGRDKNKTKLKDLYDLLSPLIRGISEDRARFQNFVNVLEAIVAYHKAAGGE